jgi:uncharacterized protein (TIGR02231 family)
MKIKIILSLLLGAIFLINESELFASVIEVESKITRVMVYPKGATISRKAHVKLSSGEQKIAFPNIIPEIDEDSLQVNVEGEARVRLFGASVQKEFLEEIPSERIRELKKEIQRLKDEKRKKEDNKKILLEEKQFLDSIRLFSQEQLPKDLITKIPSAEELGETLEFLHTRLTKNYSQVLEIELQIREINKKIDAIKRELSQISTPLRKLKRSIVVELKVLKPGIANINISYLVKGASWKPVYDARADFVNSKVELVSYGIVRQNTGEDWEDVEVSLSTAKPAIGGRMPYVDPWFLRAYHPPAPLRMEKVPFKAKARGGDIGYQYAAFVEEELRKEDISGVKYAQPEERGTAVVYQIAQKRTIKADGSEHKLPIFSQVLEAEFKYSTYPRRSLFAYLGSRVRNTQNLQLLKGKVNIFLEGDFVGTSSIDNIGPGEEFDLYLGVDENVKVKRELIEKKIDDVLLAGIPSPTRRITFKYKTTIENYKNKKIKVIFFEAMPVSQDERIKVKIGKANVAPQKKDWKDRKGIWRWELELKPQEKKEIIYTFSIEHPRNMQVEGL